MGFKTSNSASTERTSKEAVPDVSGIVHMSTLLMDSHLFLASHHIPPQHQKSSIIPRIVFHTSRRQIHISTISCLYHTTPETVTSISTFRIVQDPLQTYLNFLQLTLRSISPTLFLSPIRLDLDRQGLPKNSAATA